MLDDIVNFLNDPQENIVILAVTTQITGLLQAVNRELKSKQECLDILTPYYQTKLIRMRYTLMDLADKIVKIMPPEGMELHMSLIYDIINNHEP